MRRTAVRDSWRPGWPGFPVAIPALVSECYSEFYRRTRLDSTSERAGVSGLAWLAESTTSTWPRMPCCSPSPHNAVHVRNALILGSALRLALAQAISLTDLLRLYGRL